MRQSVTWPLREGCGLPRGATVLMWHSMRMPQVVSEAVDKPRNIQFKGTTDLVTDTDQASEDAVLAVRTWPM